MNQSAKRWLVVSGEVALLVALFFAVTGVAPPAVNEAHYFAKSKNFWDPTWCSRDIFASSGNPHLLFHFTFGAITKIASLETTAWIGRLIGWTMLAIGLRALVHAMTKVPLASLSVAILWIAGVKQFNLAGEWVVGGIEGKVPAYALLLLSLRWMIDGQWRRVWPTLGLASGFHVLVGGWSVLIAMTVYWRYGRQSQPLRTQIVPLVVGGFISLSGVVPALILTRGLPPETVAAAARIYSFERLSHHLLPSGLETVWYVRHGFMIALFALVGWMLSKDCKFRIVRSFATGAIVIALIGMAIGTLQNVAPDTTASLLRYYWFRMTDSMVPLAFALGWVRLPEAEVRIAGIFALRVVTMAVALGMVIVEAKQTSDSTVITESGEVASTLGMATRADNHRRVVSDWIKVCRWVDRTLPPDEILLTPRNQQSFKWYANRAEVVNWKDVPQDAERLIEWSHRFYDVFPRRLGTTRVTIRYPDLIRYRQEYGARFMIVDRRYSGQSLPLVQVYPIAPHETNQTYAVYRLP